MQQLEDVSRIRRLLNTDRVWCGYALADLDPEYWPHTEWHGNGEAVALLYHAVSPPFLFTHGPDADLLPILDVVVRYPALLISVGERVAVELEARGYGLTNRKRMLRMGHHGAEFAMPRGACVPLSEEHASAVQALHAEGETPDFFLPSMLASRTYFGIFEEGALVATAGTHIVSDRESVAAVGNVYVKRTRRGQGLGKAVTSAVTGSLRERGIQTILLSVEEGNIAAQRAYLRLGFELHMPFVQALAARPSEPGD